MNDKISEYIRSAFGKYKTKYSILNDNLNLSKLDAVHINLDSMLKKISAKSIKEIFSETLDESYKYSISAIILNTIGHYRHYFVKNNLNPKIYIYVTPKLWDDVIISAIDLMTIIIKYFDGVYLIKLSKKDVNCVIMNYFIDKKEPNLIISSDIIDSQLISKHVTMLKPGKESNCHVTIDSFYINLFSKPLNINFSHKLIGPMLFFSGYGIPDHNGVRGYGITRTVSLFNKAVKNKSISDTNYVSAEDFISDIIKEFDDADKDLNVFKDTFNEYSVKKLFKETMTDSKKEILDSYIIDKYPGNDIYEINKTYYLGLDSIILDYFLEVPK